MLLSLVLAATAPSPLAQERTNSGAFALECLPLPMHDQWENLLPGMGTGTQWTHKGPQSNAKCARTKVSTQRRQALFESAVTDDSSMHVTHAAALPTEHLRDTSTQEEGLWEELYHKPCI
ncbi:hypothetical protein BJ138DRAFT_1102964 [Hygrophoropsis aurantiaca]|uniref:Uncharacterized protein n=1 Tax=Hygrophoropsis aurantiaca TaxID=72124 RepID=A0ACB8A794_9AGAM|nr:hypothetical protein BJ138DRAFT_1102964 [Hygrophoropsis aurantiaca]